MKFIAAQTLETRHTIDGCEVVIKKSVPPMVVTDDGVLYSFQLKALAALWVGCGAATILTGCIGAALLSNAWCKTLFLSASAIVGFAIAGHAFEWTPGPPAGLYTRTVISSDGRTVTVEDEIY